MTEANKAIEDRIENPPAFPMGNPEQGGYDGMTLRDWFAGQALIGMHSESPWDAASAAYDYADAMLRARTGDTDND